MTASIGNAKRAIELLTTHAKMLTEQHKLRDLMILIDSVRKCMDSLASQLAFYEGIKSPLRTMQVAQPDGACKTVSAMELIALDLPGSDHKVYGKPEAIAALKALLATPDQPEQGREPCTISPLKQPCS
ncbi:hypothetical protein [Roseibium algae]|uniref:Uncharacterized protein n=1 Tax=Roseibium algae TaxID=3123038 RepID=A0ABU8TK22_9HYPH